ncbi:Methyltransferase domain-containing protein [Halopseudomonas xinjiangensis]|uniref:Methyltransferase domain-containing protein n=1 Tax=Halopseudomonas xinjiangensis TaxID=487184 RepID=A0A1H1RWD0_9GAMM|nr:methyltransferase domain-containing protein [Halopseudomonas xinjiangensis]SDS39985.1 Methyltransferase domain-containing protein [Halopseudomonas xinjiangensis]
MEIPDVSRSISQDDLLRLLDVARAWLESPPGLMLLEAEREVMRNHLSRCFGQHLVQYGLAPALLDQERSVLRNHWHLDLSTASGAIPAEESQWPFAPQSLDVVVLHHGLDFCLTPRSLLREASQAVRAGGHMLIFGFNPWSLWGASHFTGRGWFSEAGFVSPARLTDWLELLGFAVEKRVDGCYRPPLASEAWLGRLHRLENFAGRHQLPGGGFYFLVARRQMLGTTPRRERGMVFPALTLPPLVVGSRRTHKRNRK